MFEKARASYIVFGDRDVYDDMLRIGSFIDEDVDLRSLIQGTASEGNIIYKKHFIKYLIDF